MPVFKCCNDPDCAGRRVSKRKWCHDAFVAPPYPLGVNPYLGYPPVFGSRMQMSAASGADGDRAGACAANDNDNVDYGAFETDMTVKFAEM